MVFTAQLVVFIGQETAEAAAAGGPLPSVLQLLFWGALGQLPAALIASAVVAWLLTRLETAWTTIVAGVAAVLGEPEAPAPAATGRPRRTPSSTLESAFPAAFRKRGPPALPDRAAA